MQATPWRSIHASPRHCAPLPAALPEPQSSQILRHACTQPAAQSPGDARTCVSSYGASLVRSLKNGVFGENTPFTYALGYLVNPPSAWPGFSRPLSTPVHEHVHKCPAPIAQARATTPSLTPRLGWVAC